MHADDSIVSIVVPENTTADVAGNKNLESNRLHLRHCKHLHFFFLVQIRQEFWRMFK